MLQRALATLLCLLGAASIGLGIASATVWRASDTLVASAEGGQGTTLLLTEPGVLDMAAETVSVRATSTSGEKVVLALGRTADVEAWVGPDAHTTVTGLLDRSTLSTQDVVAEEQPDAAEAPAPATDPATADPAADPSAADAEAAAAPDPAGSDLWVAEASGPDEATLEWAREDGRWSILAASVGADAGPVTLTLTWPQEVTTPWLVPGVAAGAVLLLAGIVWWTLLLLRGRRSRPGVRVGAGSVPAARPTAPVTPAPADEGSSTAARPLVPAGPPPAATGPAAPPATVGAGRQVQGTGVDQTGAPLPTPVGSIPGPVTRRQLREREQQLAQQAEEERAAARSGRARVRPDGAADPSQPEPTATQPAPTGAPAGPPAKPGTTPPRPTPPGATAAPPSARQPAPAPDVLLDAAVTGKQPGPGAGVSASPLTRWGRRLVDRAPRRTPAGAIDVTPATGDAADRSAPGGLPVSGRVAARTTGPVAGDTRPETGHAASADMWRRAWGFPSADEGDATGAAPGTWVPEQPGAPASGGQPAPRAPRTEHGTDEHGTDEHEGDRR